MFTMTVMAGEITPYRADLRTVDYCRRVSDWLLLGLLRLCDLVLFARVNDILLLLP
jgi:hypothetical protein